MGSMLALTMFIGNSLDMEPVNTIDPRNMAALYRKNRRLFERYCQYWPTALADHEKDNFAAIFCSELGISNSSELVTIMIGNSNFLPRIRQFLARKPSC